MILDSLLNFGETDIGVNASSQVEATNSLQLDNVIKYLGTAFLGDTAHNDPGKAGSIMLNVRVTSEAIVAAVNGATIDIELYKHSSGTSIVSGTKVMTVTLTGINLAATEADIQKLGSYLFRGSIPMALWGDTTNKFIGLAFLPKAQNLSAGKVTAWLGDANDNALPLV